MPTLRVPVGGNGHRSIQRPIQTRSDGRCPDVRKKISQSVSHKSEPHPLNRQELDEKKIKDLLTAAIAACRVPSFTNADTIFDVIFNYRNDRGFAGLFDKATHLVTEFPRNQTENYNLNFIFKNPMDDDIYEGETYSQLARLMLFLHVMQIELYGRMREPKAR